MELDNLKQIWKEQKTSSFDKEKILSMRKVKSSSVAKWIFYISIAEFIFWIGLSVLFPDNNSDLGENATLVLDIITYLNYAIIIGFIILFFKNYKKISAEQNIKQLLKNILNLRRTVRRYVIYNLAMFLGSSILIIVFILNDETNGLQLSEELWHSTIFWVIFVTATVILLAIFLVALYFFYRLLYGFLLRRLQRNYAEIKELQ